MKQEDGEWLSKDEFESARVHKGTVENIPRVPVAKGSEEGQQLIAQAMSILKDNAWKRGTSGMKLAKQMGKSPQLLCNYRSGYKPLTTNMAARIVAAFDELTAKQQGINNEDGD